MEKSFIFIHRDRRCRDHSVQNFGYNHHEARELSDNDRWAIAE